MNNWFSISRNPENKERDVPKPLIFILGAAFGYFLIPWLMEAPARFR